jgi:hypothetical protein
VRNVFVSIVLVFELIPCLEFCLSFFEGLGRRKLKLRMWRRRRRKWLTRSQQLRILASQDV